MNRSFVRLVTRLVHSPDVINSFVLEAQPFTPETVIRGISLGLFPCPYDPHGGLMWHDPDPRAILPIQTFHVPHSVRQLVRQRRFDLTLDMAFDQVITACAQSPASQEQLWLHPYVIQTFQELHRMGLAHSVEVWQDGELVGGDISVTLGSHCMGATTFHRVRDSSKVALIYLNEMLMAGGFVLEDAWWRTEYLAQFGVIEIPRAEFKRRLAHALIKPARLEPLSMDEFVQRVERRREAEKKAELVTEQNRDS